MPAKEQATSRVAGRKAGGDHAARYAGLAERLGDMVSVHDPDGTVRYVSSVSQELMGYRPRDLVGSWSFDHVHPDDADRFTAAHRNALEGVATTVSYRLRRRKGGYKWVETMSRAVLADGDRGPVSEIVAATRPLNDRSAVARVAGAEENERLERVQKVLADGAIEPVFQPIFQLGSGRVVAYEGLSRFPSDDARGPHRWFEDAWRVGLGVPLELLAIRAICSSLPQIPEDRRLTVNASPPTLASPRFLGLIGDDAERITVELTENIDIEQHEQLAAALKPFLAAGGRTAIDDFGAGYAGLKHLVTVSPHWVKLDISLTERIGENAVAHELAVALLSFAERSGIEVIAEGIETEDELEALTELGVHLGQGYHLGMAAPLSEALQSTHLG